MINFLTRKHNLSECYSYGDAISYTVKSIVQSKGYDKVIASTSAFGKDVIPKLGGLLDVQPITDVIQIIVREL
jgi:electron transfer flavoprotein alpha subunit